MDPVIVGTKLRQLRQDAGITTRDLAERAGVSPAGISAIERGDNSPTLATLHRILRALGTDFATFFAEPEQQNHPPVFRESDMVAVESAHRYYELILHGRDDLKFQMIYERIEPAETQPEWESHDADVGGVVLGHGSMLLEIEDVGSWDLAKGDAFYVRAGQRHRARNTGTDTLNLLIVTNPPVF